MRRIVFGMLPNRMKQFALVVVQRSARMVAATVRLCFLLVLASSTAGAADDCLTTPTESCPPKARQLANPQNPQREPGRALEMARRSCDKNFFEG